MVAIQDGIIICRRIVVAELLASLVNTVDIPSLCIVLSHAFTGIVSNPCCGIVIRQREKVGNALLSTNKLQQGVAGIGGQVVVEVVCILCYFDDAAGLVHQCAVEIAVADNGADCIASTCRGKADSHRIEVVDVCFEIVLGEVGANIREVVQQVLPIHIPQFGQFEDGGKFLVDFQECDVPEGKPTVGDNGLKLIAECLCLFAHLIQIAAPIEGVLRTTQHHACHSPDLGHNLGGDHVVDASVIIVLCGACP